MFSKVITVASLLAASATAAPAPQNGSGNPPSNTRLHCGFHWISTLDGQQFLQNTNYYAPGSATLDTLTNAGQFEIVSGGLIELTSSIPQLGYNYAMVDDSTGAVGFEAGVLPPAGSGTFKFDSSPNQLLTYTTGSGVLASGFMMCDGELFANIPSVPTPNRVCSSVVIAKSQALCTPIDA